MIRLWQLLSPNLPTGAYAYSGGMESAHDAGWVTDSESCGHWIRQLLEQGLARTDLPLYLRLHRSWGRNDNDAANHWAGELLSWRETAELRQEDLHLGRALQRLLISLDVPAAASAAPACFSSLFALACTHWQIDSRSGGIALAWNWVDNQVTAALKLVPLGQTEAQQLLASMAPTLPGIIDAAFSLPDDDIGASLPGYALLSSAHETQHTRLFRS